MSLLWSRIYHTNILLLLNSIFIMEFHEKQLWYWYLLCLFLSLWCLYLTNKLICWERSTNRAQRFCLDLCLSDAIMNVIGTMYSLSLHLRMREDMELFLTEKTEKYHMYGQSSMCYYSTWIYYGINTTHIQ